MFGEIPTDIWDEHTLIRFYFSCMADRIGDLVHQLTGELNRYQVPYRMKALTDPAHYSRTDSMVLYCARRYFASVAGIITSLGPAAAAGLKDSVPLFAKPVRPGVAVDLAQAVTSTTVSPMETRTAPSAWRAISPVSIVTECSPYGNVLLTTLNGQSSEKCFGRGENTKAARR